MRVCIDIPDTMLDKMMELVNKGYFKNKSELIRYAVRRILEEYK